MSQKNVSNNGSDWCSDTTRRRPSQVFFAITDRRDIGLYDVPMLMSLLGLGIGMMLANFHT